MCDHLTPLKITRKYFLAAITRMLLWLIVKATDNHLLAGKEQAMDKELLHYFPTSKVSLCFCGATKVSKGFKVVSVILYTGRVLKVEQDIFQ